MCFLHAAKRMFFRWRRDPGRRKIRDTCIACSSPVYEDEPAFDVLGLWMHRKCYDRDLGLDASPSRTANRMKDAA